MGIFGRDCKGPVAFGHFWFCNQKRKRSIFIFEVAANYSDMANTVSGHCIDNFLRFSRKRVIDDLIVFFCFRGIHVYAVGCVWLFFIEKT